MPTSRLLAAAAAAASLLALVVVPVAAAAPPPNDNRATAAPLGAFPFDVHGSLVEATLERLDPQISKCGTVASTVWYRIDTAPDGTINVAVQGAAGVAPVIRVYARGSSALRELTCGSAAAGGVATASFETTRGSNYLILVGRKPASADGDFDLHADLALPPEPPANDHAAGAARLKRLPSSARGTTVGARSDDNDPEGCGLAGATVWYRVRAPRKGLIVLKLHADGKLDAVLDVVAQARSRLVTLGCGRTNEHGDATVAFAASSGQSYLIAVGDQDGSRPGSFSLTGVAAAAPERSPGRALSARPARATVDGLVNVNDVWHTTLAAGTTYRIAFTSVAGARAALRRGRDQAVLLSFSGSGYRTFTPGPDGGGLYVLDVEAAPTERPQPYRLQVAAAGADDIGFGLPLLNQRARPGRLDPRGIDTVDIYHFDVERRSDVKLAMSSGADYRLELVTSAGGRLGAGGATIHRVLEAGRYVVAVSASPGTAAAAYRLTLLVRDITATSLKLAAPTVTPRTTVVLDPTVSPAASGTIEIQIDRFDPLAGWQFTRVVRIPAGDSVSWTAPAEGTWRIRASYLGSASASPSRSGYAYLTVR